MKQFDVLVAGEINPDLILIGDVLPEFGQVEKLVDSAKLTIGSSSVIFACGVARLGLKVGFIGVVGDDLFGQFMLKSMQQRNIDISNVIVNQEQSTGFSVILNKGTDRAILTFVGAIDALSPKQLTDELLSQTRHLHIASYFLQNKLRPGVLDIFQRARIQGLSTSLDVNWDPAGKWAGVYKVLEVTNVFFPNDREGQSLTGKKTPERVVEELTSSVETVAMKMGADGAIARRGNQVYRVPALKVDVVDTVGAGDTFDAGFIYGYLRGWSLNRSLELAVVCGSLSTQASGGTIGQPTLEEALKVIRKLDETI